MLSCFTEITKRLENDQDNCFEQSCWHLHKYQPFQQPCNDSQDQVVSHFEFGLNNDPVYGAE